MNRSPTIEWLGCATFRLQIRGLTIFFDTYLDDDRAPGGSLVGLKATDVIEADFAFISHAHFDHMLGADVIANNTGATVVGSYEVTNILSNRNVDVTHLLPISGGEPVECGHDVMVTAFPGLHSCLFAEGSRESGDECVGSIGISAQDRRAKAGALLTTAGTAGGQIGAWYERTLGRSSPYDGGQLAYLVESPDGSIFVSSSAGHWSGILDRVKPDLAILAATGRPNLDGEPFQGSLATFLLRQVETLKPRSLIFSHHDALMDSFMANTNLDAARSLLRAEASHVEMLTLDYSDPVPVLH
jgi:L-ascorbate metabolism protein UlaG (beta-lactamase superfamily)